MTHCHTWTRQQWKTLGRTLEIPKYWWKVCTKFGNVDFFIHTICVHISLLVYTHTHTHTHKHTHTHTHTHTHRVIKMSLCIWWLQYRKLEVMFKVFLAHLQTFSDTPNCVLPYRVQYNTVRIPNVFCDGHLQIISCVGIVLYCNHQVQRDFWSSCIYVHARRGLYR